MATRDHWGDHAAPRCPECGQPMEQFYALRSLRRLAVCASCFIVEEWRLAVLRDEPDPRTPPQPAR